MQKVISAFILSLFAHTAFAQKVKDAPAIYEDNILYGGCWFVPHNSGVNIRFSEFGNFQFVDYDKEKAAEVTHSGKYLLDGHNLWLIYNDRPKEKFFFTRGDGTDKTYYIKGYPLQTSAYIFVHGTCD